MTGGGSEGGVVPADVCETPVTRSGLEAAEDHVPLRADDHATDLGPALLSTASIPTPDDDEQREDRQTNREGSGAQAPVGSTSQDTARVRAREDVVAQAICGAGLELAVAADRPAEEHADVLRAFVQRLARISKPIESIVGAVLDVGERRRAGVPGLGYPMLLPGGRIQKHALDVEGDELRELLYGFARAERNRPRREDCVGIRWPAALDVPARSEADDDLPPGLGGDASEVAPPPPASPEPPPALARVREVLRAAGSTALAADEEALARITRAAAPLGPDLERVLAEAFQGARQAHAIAPMRRPEVVALIEAKLRRAAAPVQAPPALDVGLYAGPRVAAMLTPDDVGFLRSRARRGLGEDLGDRAVALALASEASRSDTYLAVNDPRSRTAVKHALVDAIDRLLPEPPPASRVAARLRAGTMRPLDSAVRDELLRQDPPTYPAPPTARLL